MGCEFDKWSDGVTTAKRQDTYVTASKTVTAIFRRFISYKYTTDGNGEILANTTIPQKKPTIQGSILYGKELFSVEAIPYDGYEFVEWSDGITTAERQDKNITKPINVTAIFKKKEYIPKAFVLGESKLDSGDYYV